ncbi:MAG: Gfo/Idh/MocA family oxidoreductase [Silicimonas sp.]|nr:Gfo/Idh/MocA family oxidoreductase [Silicimonas sp.]
MGAGTAKIAVVGAGLIGRKHLDVVSAEAQLAAVIDPNPEAEALAQDHGAPWFPSLDEALAKVTPDGAIIATPNPLHAANGTTCLKAGIPALIEKPLTASVEEGRALVALEAATGTPILVGHHRRHSPIAKEAKSLIDAGRLGRVVTVNAMFWLHKPADYFSAEWRTKEGGGPTYINLIHDIDMLQHFCGPITRVQAREAHAVRGFEVEDTSAVILEFASGALGTVSISDTTSAPWSWELTAGENPAYPKTDEACYRIGGTMGALSVPDMALWTHEGEASWWAPIGRETLALTTADPIIEQFRHFLDVINGTPPLVRAEEGLRNIEVLDAIKRAARTGGVVEL